MCSLKRLWNIFHSVPWLALRLGVFLCPPWVQFVAASCNSLAPISIVADVLIVCWLDVLPAFLERGTQKRGWLLLLPPPYKYSNKWKHLLSVLIPTFLYSSGYTGRRPPDPQRRSEVEGHTPLPMAVHPHTVVLVETLEGPHEVVQTAASLGLDIRT